MLLVLTAIRLHLSVLCCNLSLSVSVLSFLSLSLSLPLPFTLFFVVNLVADNLTFHPFILSVCLVSLLSFFVPFAVLDSSSSGSSTAEPHMQHTPSHTQQ